MKLNVNDAKAMLANGGGSRPFIHPETGEACVVVNNNGKKELITVNDALLRYDEWKDIDTTVISAARERLVGIADLKNAGLVHNLGSVGITISQWESQGEMTGADFSMSGVTRGEEDTPNYSLYDVPVPIIHKDFRLNWRRLEASRRLGESLDVTGADDAGRSVAEASEDMLFASNPIQVEGKPIYGYTNFPDRATVEISDWSDSTNVSGQDILDEVQEILQAARDNRHYGPFTLYIPGEYEGRLDEDFDPDTSDTRTIRDRLMALSGLERITVADRLADGNVVLVQLSRRVVDLAEAQEINTVNWEAHGGFLTHFKTLAVWVPRLKVDSNGNTAIVHGSTP